MAASIYRKHKRNYSDKQVKTDHLSKSEHLSKYCYNVKYVQVTVNKQVIYVTCHKTSDLTVTVLGTKVRTVTM